jgi:hypothetical protein
VRETGHFSSSFVLNTFIEPFTQASLQLHESDFMLEKKAKILSSSAGKLIHGETNSVKYKVKPADNE